jgi:uncharacterized protein (DUF3084 family)
MTIELRDVITGLSVIVAVIGMLIVNRNAKRALRPAMENTDLARIRDLRSELAEAKQELDAVRGQVHALNIQAKAANDAALEAYRERQEMLSFARMPGVTMEDWLRRFDQAPPELNGRP